MYYQLSVLHLKTSGVGLTHEQHRGFQSLLPRFLDIAQAISEGNLVIERNLVKERARVLSATAQTLGLNAFQEAHCSGTTR